jgi:hypothetical protein
MAIKFFPIMEHKGPLPSSHKFAFRPYFEPVQSHPPFTPNYLKIHFIIVLPSKQHGPHTYSFIEVLWQISYVSFISLKCIVYPSHLIMIYLTILIIFGERKSDSMWPKKMFILLADDYPYKMRYNIYSAWCMHVLIMNPG